MLRTRQTGTGESSLLGKPRWGVLRRLVLEQLSNQLLLVHVEIGGHVP